MSMEHTRNAVKRQIGTGWLIAALVVFGILQANWHRVEESRLYRDITGMTPFHSVEFEASLTPDGRAILNGAFVKRRCDFKGLSAFTVTAGVTHRALIDDAEDNGGVSYSKPPSERKYRFGPWYITALFPEPHEWIVFARHLCPEGVVVTLFAEGAWP